MTERRKQLDQLFQPTVEKMGYEYIGHDMLLQGRFSLLRIYITRESGLNIDDCAEVSHQISGVLEVEDIIKGQYQLEVSSPGLNRPLFTLAQFSGAIGQQVKLRVSMPIEQQRKFSGKLESVVDETITLLLDEKEVSIPYSIIEKANVVYQF